MAAMGLVSSTSLDGLTAELPLQVGKRAPMPEVIVFSSAPMRELSDLAAAGLKLLVALLPMIKQAVADGKPQPLSQLVKAATTAARHLADGHEALFAEGPNRVAAALRGEAPEACAVSDARQLLRTLARQIGADAPPGEPRASSESLRRIARQIGAADPLELRFPSSPDADPIQRWAAEAKHVLRSTGDLLDRAEQQLATTELAWVLREIQAAQAQVDRAYAAICTARIMEQPRTTRPTLSLDNLAGVSTLVGMLFTVSTLWLLGGFWSVVTGVAALVVAAAWTWRVNRSPHDVALDPRG